MLKKKHNTPYYVLFPLVPIIFFSTLHSQRPQYTQTTTTTKNTPKKKKIVLFNQWLDLYSKKAMKKKM
jgi:hypothetical protein